MSDETTNLDDANKKPSEPAQEPAKKPKRAPRAQQPEVFFFETREREPATFAIAGVTPERSFADGRLTFKVKQHQLQAFKSHYHVVTGRVVRKHDNS